MNDETGRHARSATTTNCRLENTRSGGHLRRLPRPGLAATPLQRACWHLGEAIRAAREDERADCSFVDILIQRTAKESARLRSREF
jgi:hypothetical protein